eukprot:gene4175-14276_t
MSSTVFECQGSLLLDIACVPSLVEALIALPSRLLDLPFLHSPQLQGLITRNSLDIHLRKYRLVRLDPTISAAILVTMLTDRGLMVEKLTRPDVVHASLEEQALGVVPIGSNTSADVLVSGSLGLPPVIRMVLPSSGGEANRISLVRVDNHHPPHRLPVLSPAAIKQLEERFKPTADPPPSSPSPVGPGSLPSPPPLPGPPGLHGTSRSFVQVLHVASDGPSAGPSHASPVWEGAGSQLPPTGERGGRSHVVGGGLVQPTSHQIVQQPLHSARRTPTRPVGQPLSTQMVRSPIHQAGGSPPTPLGRTSLPLSSSFDAEKVKWATFKGTRRSSAISLPSPHIRGGPSSSSVVPSPLSRGTNRFGVLETCIEDSPVLDPHTVGLSHVAGTPLTAGSFDTAGPSLLAGPSSTAGPSHAAGPSHMAGPSSHAPHSSMMEAATLGKRFGDISEPPSKKRGSLQTLSTPSGVTIPSPLLSALTSTTIAVPVSLVPVSPQQVPIDEFMLVLNTVSPIAATAASAAPGGVVPVIASDASGGVVLVTASAALGGGVSATTSVAPGGVVSATTSVAPGGVVPAMVSATHGPPEPPSASVYLPPPTSPPGLPGLITRPQPILYAQPSSQSLAQVREALRLLVDATSKTLADQVILARVFLTSVLMTIDKLVDDSGEVQAAYATLEVDSSGQDARRLVRLAFLTASLALSDGVRYNAWLAVMQRSFLDSELPNQDVPLSFLLPALERMKAFATSSSLTFLLDQSVDLAAQPPPLS